MTLAPGRLSDADFLAVFNRLAVALRETQDETGVTQHIYFEALKDLPLVALEAGAAAIMKEPWRRFFPTTAEWRAAASLAREQQVRASAQPVRTEPWRHECDACGDTGWVWHHCDGSNLCGRERKHAPHPYVMVCLCRPMNRTFQHYTEI